MTANAIPAASGTPAPRRLFGVVPGLLLAAMLAVGGEWLASAAATAAGLHQGAISGIMMAILLGIVVGNVVSLPAWTRPGITLAVKRVLQLGIVLLGIRLSIVEVGAIGIRGLPVIAGTVVTALVLVTYAGRRIGLTARLGTLIAVGTSICGATAIVATAPTIGADDDEVSYSVACITLFGVVAMLGYPFLAHAIFGGDPFRAGLFLGTAVHETAQVAGAGLVYQQNFGDAKVLDVATVTKLVRNLSMLLVIPLMAMLYHRRASGGDAAPGWRSLVPLFIVGFAAMSALRTVGDIGPKPFGVLEPAQWKAVVGVVRDAAGYCLAIAMAAVGLGTSIRGLLRIGLAPLGLGLVSALVVGAVSLALIVTLV